MARDDYKLYPKLHDKFWLYEQYWGNNLSQNDIANIIGCNRVTVQHALKRHNINARTLSEASKSKHRGLCNYNWLFQKYQVEKLSSIQIGEMVGCASNTVLSALSKLNISVRSISEAKIGAKKSDAAKQKMSDTKRALSKKELKDKGWLVEQYVELERPVREIGEDIGCSGQTVLNWLNIHEIPAREQRGEQTERSKEKQRTGDKGICKNCGVATYIQPCISKSTDHTGDFCSRACYNEWQRRNQITKICKNCGNEFSVPVSKSGESCCSISCAYNYYSGVNNWNWKGGKQDITCEVCGKVFKDYLAARKGKHITCSRSCARQLKKIPKHHTLPELIFEEICNKNNLPFHFVGDSQLWIGKGKKKLNPDFCELNGKKIVVEIFGNYWHSPLINRKIVEYQTLDYRKKHYKKYGWTPIFLWELDLKRGDAEQFVLNVLRKEGVI